MKFIADTNVCYKVNHTLLSKLIFCCILLNIHYIKWF